MYFTSLLQQPGHMSVSQLGRITFRLAGDGFNAQFVDLSGRGRGKDYLIFQIRKESIPERIILKHIQDSWKPTLSSDRLVLRERSIGKEFLIFIFEQVRHMVLILLFANATFAPVARDILTAPENLLMVRRQLLVQPLQLAIVVLYSRVLIFSIGSIVVAFPCSYRSLAIRAARKRP